MADFSALGPDMSEIAEEVDIIADHLSRRVALILHQTVVLATPVDTGRARSNWVVTVEKRDYKAIEPYVPMRKGGIGEQANAGAAIAQGRAAITSAGPKIHERGIYIQNNVYYLDLLNTIPISPQADPGFIERAVDAAFAAATSSAEGLL